jgi:hypothetical protein
MSNLSQGFFEKQKSEQTYHYKTLAFGKRIYQNTLLELFEINTKFCYCTMQHVFWSPVLQ